MKTINFRRNTLLNMVYIMIYQRVESIILSAMKEACKQTLELAAENASVS